MKIVFDPNNPDDVTRVMAIIAVPDPDLTAPAVVGDPGTTTAPSESADDDDTPATEGVELDKNGIPWDERIHAGTKTKTAKGVWKRKKGVDDDTFNSVTTQLKAAVTNGDTPAPEPEEDNTAAPPPPAPEEPEPELLYITSSGNFTRQELIDAGWTDNLIEPLPTVPAEVNTTEVKDFSHFMQLIVEYNVQDEDAVAACQAEGVETLALLAARPDLIPNVAKRLFD